MPSEKIRIILNPGAGSAGDAEALLEKVHAIVPGARVVQAATYGDIERLAREALDAGCDSVVAAGGDGTLNGALNGLARALRGDRAVTIRLGVLPLGTGNDFARSVGVPPDLDHALAVLREGQTKRVDVIRVSTSSSERYLINASSGGFGTKVSENANEGAKDLWGRLGYAAGFIGALPQRDDYDTLICLDDGETLAVPAYSIIVANGRFIAGGIPIAPEAQLDDGLADLVILPVASLPEIAFLTPLTLLGRHLGDERILFRRARKIHIRSEPAMRFNADGELLPAEPITFQVLPRALDFIVGPAALR